jgi:hypothetical protein
VAKSTGASVAVGLGLVGTGAVLAFGGVTGRLAAMLAALFYPSALVPASGGNITPLIVPPETTPPADSGGGAGGGGGGTPPATPPPAVGTPPAPPAIGPGGLLGDLELIAGG